jgi:hypothetical protein
VRACCCGVGRGIFFFSCVSCERVACMLASLSPPLHHHHHFRWHRHHDHH